jgi:hypothetical protein
LRELTYEFERNGQPWAQEMFLNLGGALKVCNATRAQGATALPVTEIETFTVYKTNNVRKCQDVVKLGKIALR